MANRRAITTAQALRYRSASRAEKARILDAVCAMTGFHRDYARRALRRAASSPAGQGQGAPGADVRARRRGGAAEVLGGGGRAARGVRRLDRHRRATAVLRLRPLTIRRRRSGSYEPREAACQTSRRLLALTPPRLRDREPSGGVSPRSCSLGPSVLDFWWLFEHGTRNMSISDLLPLTSAG